MGTRADFYVGLDETAEWLGSIAWDGYPEGGAVSTTVSVTEEAFRKNVKKFLSTREDATKPEQGWPWPWDDSKTTDYAYCFDKDHVEIFCFGRPYKYYDYIDSEDPEEKKKAEEFNYKVDFPDMKKIQKVDYGKRSGVMFLTIK